jgi:hypothetical protein
MEYKKANSGCFGPVNGSFGLERVFGTRLSATPASVLKFAFVAEPPSPPNLKPPFPAIVVIVSQLLPFECAADSETVHWPCSRHLGLVPDRGQETGFGEASRGWLLRGAAGEEWEPTMLHNSTYLFAHLPQRLSTPSPCTVQNGSHRRALTDSWDRICQYAD